MSEMTAVDLLLFMAKVIRKEGVTEFRGKPVMQSDTRFEAIAKQFEDKAQELLTK